MKHTVEIADSNGKTMKIAVSAETFGYGGSWRSLDKGMIRYNGGPVEQRHPEVGLTYDIQLESRADRTGWGVYLRKFISCGTVNDEGSGLLAQAWVLGLTPGEIEWSIV